MLGASRLPSTSCPRQPNEKSLAQGGLCAQPSAEFFRLEDRGPCDVRYCRDKAASTPSSYSALRRPTIKNRPFGYQSQATRLSPISFAQMPCVVSFSTV